MWNQRLLLVGFLAIALAGCGVGRDDGRNVITGLVTLDDQPLPGARVQFFSTKSSLEVPTALFGARTDAEGRYRTTGAPGQYRVAIMKWERKDGFALDPRFDDPGQMEMQPKQDPNSPYRLAVPEDYTSADKTPLVRDVTTGPQTIDLPVKTPRMPAKK